jgi:hypothetical protein
MRARVSERGKVKSKCSYLKNKTTNIENAGEKELEKFLYFFFWDKKNTMFHFTAGNLME